MQNSDTSFSSAETAPSTPQPQPTPAATSVERPARRSAAVAILTRLDPLFLVTLAGAAVLRFYNLNWDQGTHIHPDERFLTMVGNAVKIPSSLAQYLNPQTSPLYPPNILNANGTQEFGFYVYGILPITINKLLAINLGHDTYDLFTIQGRFLSALADLLALVFIYLIVRLLERKYGVPRAVRYLAPALYGICVLPIQLAHFFAVDTFLNLFMVASLYFAMRCSVGDPTLNAFLSALFFALAMASKTSAVYILPLDLWLVLSPVLAPRSHSLSDASLGHADVEESPKERSRFGSGPSQWLSGARRWLSAWWDDLRHDRRRFASALGLLALYGLASYICLRIADPYVFNSSNVLDPSINHVFLSNLKQLQGYNNPSAQYPPGVQWVHKTAVLFALKNLVFFGLGLPITVLAVIGSVLILRRPVRHDLLAMWVWACAFFLYQSTQYVKTMRYFIFLYPLLAIFAAIGLQAVARRPSHIYRAALAVGLLIWPLAFMSIYMHHHSRVQASEWMYRSLPNNSYVLSESWDDPLPIGVTNTYGKSFLGDQLPVFDPDLVLDPRSGRTALNVDKWNKMARLLRRGSYLVLSSNRGWGSMPTVPEQFPEMTRFYHDLFAGRPLPHAHVVYKRLATFTSYPSLSYLGIPIDFPDQWAEEAFTVYDHPEVIIFARSG